MSPKARPLVVILVLLPTPLTALFALGINKFFHSIISFVATLIGRWGEKFNLESIISSRHGRSAIFPAIFLEVLK